MISNPHKRDAHYFWKGVLIIFIISVVAVAVSLPHFFQCVMLIGDGNPGPGTAGYACDHGVSGYLNAPMFLLLFPALIPIVLVIGGFLGVAYGRWKSR